MQSIGIWEKKVRVTVKNCNDESVVQLIRKALHYYARQLFTKGGHNGLTVSVVLIDDTSTCYADEPDQGSCCVTHYDHNWKPICFEIELLKTDLRSLISNAAHEMVHVKQFASRTISTNLDSWKGKKLRRSAGYWDEPWEIEAYGMEPCLFNKFIEQYDLKDFFYQNSRWATPKPVAKY